MIKVDKENGFGIEKKVYLEQAQTWKAGRIKAVGAQRKGGQIELVLEVTKHLPVVSYLTLIIQLLRFTSLSRARDALPNSLKILAKEIAGKHSLYLKHFSLVRCRTDKEKDRQCLSIYTVVYYIRRSSLYRMIHCQSL